MNLLNYPNYWLREYLHRGKLISTNFLQYDKLNIEELSSSFYFPSPEWFPDLTLPLFIALDSQQGMSDRYRNHHLPWAANPETGGLALLEKPLDTAPFFEFHYHWVSAFKLTGPILNVWGYGNWRIPKLFLTAEDFPQRDHGDVLCLRKR